MRTEPYSVEAHLRIAIRNALILVVEGFVIGGLVGWALSHWRTAPLGAGLGVLIGVGLMGWVMRMYSLTKGLLHTTRVVHKEVDG